MLTETIIDLREAAALPVFRRRGKKPHIAGLYRWIQAGIKNRHGEIVKLETIRVPSGMKNTVEAVERFVAALSGERQMPPTPSALRHKQIAHAEAELRAAGLLGPE